VFSDSDLIFAYSRELLEGLREECRENVLYVPVSDTTVFFPPSTETNRAGACFYADKYKKVHKGKLFPITDGALEITRDEDSSQSPKQIAEIFRRSEVFYAYENTALSLEAVLCGCPVVLLPNEHFTHVIGRDTVGSFGIAWGTDPLEVQRAKDTVGLARENYLKVIDGFGSDLERFLRKTQEKASSVRYLSKISRIPLPVIGFEYNTLSNRRLLKDSGLRGMVLFYVTALLETLVFSGMSGLMRTINSKIARFLKAK
jgi:hypothetical protein